MTVSELDAHRPARRPAPQPDGLMVAPHNLEAERALLGAMLLAPDARYHGLELCSAEDFYRPVYGHIFAAIASLVARSEEVDAVTVADELARHGLLDTVGGISELLSIQIHTPATSNAAAYARRVADDALRRRVIGTGSEISGLGYKPDLDIDVMVDQAESLMFAVARRNDADTLKPIGALVPNSLATLDERIETGVQVTGLPTGYHDLDTKLLGLHPGRLVIVGARPAMGKTSFGLGIAAHAAINLAVPTLFFSLEMSHEELTNRVLWAEARVDSTQFQSGRISAEQRQKVAMAAAKVGTAPLLIEEKADVSIMDIRAKARRANSQLGGRLGLIVVDYVQLMTSRSGAENRQLEVSEISRGLKLLARELNVPVVALCQLSRNLETRADKRPILADLRESGSLEQDSDVVLFIFRDEVYNPETTDRGMAEIIVSKNRSGPTGTVRLAYIGRYTLFANMARGV